MVSGAAEEDAADERKLIENERKKELKDAADSGGPGDGFFNAPQKEDTNEIILPQDTLPLQNGQVAPAPVDPKAAFEQQVQQVNASTAVTPAQQAQLDALFSRYMADEITTAEYQAERKKILAGGQ
jgi:hypothetical protein